MDLSQTRKEGLSEMKLELHWLNGFGVSLFWETLLLCKCEKGREGRTCLTSHACGRFLLFFIFFQSQRLTDPKQCKSVGLCVCLKAGAKL